MEITDEQVTGETIETTEAQPAEVLEPVGLGEVQPDDAGDVPAGQPSSAAVQAEESAPLRTVDHVKSDIVNIEKATERGDNDTFEKAKASQSKMKELIAERDALIAAEIDVAANQAATSELNDLAQPTDAQKKAGDYKKGLVDVNGFGIAVENPKGSTRSGKDPSGKEWSVEMKDHYGEIQNTEGADGDNVDVFIGDNPESQKVFVVDQIDPSTGKFDEHKVIMGTNDAKQAKRTYKRNYAKGWKGDGSITEMSVDEFRTWVNFGDTTKPMTYKEVTTDESPSSAASIPDKRDTISNDKNMGRIDADKTAKPRTSIPVRKAVKSKIAEASTIAAAPVKAEQFKPAVAKKPSISVKKAVAKKVKEAAGPAVIVRPKVKDFETRDTFTVPAGTTLGIESKNLATQNFDKVTADDGYITYTRKTEDTSPETSTTTAGTATDIAGLDERSAPAADVSSDTTAGAANDISVQISEAVAPVEETAKTAKPVDTPTTERAAIPSEDKTKAAAPTEMRGGEPKGVTAESLVPEPSTLAEVVKKDVTTVLDFIKARTEVPALREIIDRIKDNLPVGLKIVTLQIGDKDPSQSGMQAARGLYQIDTNTIYLKGESFVENGMSEETIIHELLHAVTADLLRAGNLKANQGTDLANAVKELYALREQVVIEFNRKMKDGWKPQTNLANIATANVDELISWGLTNTDFQDLLMSMPSDKGSVWNSFVSAISKMLGISSENQNMLSELMIATDKLISADYRVDQAMREQLQVVRESSSYKVATKSLPQMEELELLQTQVAALQLDVETKSDITAGKKLKETNAKIELLQEEIQEARAEDPYFEIGEDDVDMQGDTLMGKPADRLTLRERLKSFFDNLKVMGGDIPDIMGRIVSSAYVIEKQERDTHGSRVTAEDSMTAAVHKSWNSKVAASMAIHEHGVSMENGTIVPDHTKPGLSQILEEVANHGERYLRRFEQYLLLQRSKELMTQDRENFVTQENIDVMDSWLDRNPNTKALFEKQHKAFQTWNKSTLDIAIASGWINQQDAYGGYMAFDADGNEVMNAGNTLFETEADALEAGDTATQVEGWYSDMYVPFYRIADDKGTKKPGASKRTAGDVAKAVKKLKGGEGQIPILENIVKNAEFIINGSMRTIAMQKIETEFRDSVMEEMDGVEIPGLINAAEMREEYRNIQEEAALEGEPVPKMGQAAAKRWAQMKSFARPTDTSTVVVYRNGRPTYYKVLDERLLTALKSIGAPQAKNWLNIIGMPTRLLQKSITIMPAFLARSFVRELQNAYIINREGGVNPLKTIGKGLKNFGKIATGDMAWMDEMMTGGFVNYNTYYNVTPDKLRQKLDKAGVKRSTFKNIVLSPWEGAKALGRIYMQIAVASEHASRKAVHDDFIKAGASKEEAMYQALDTMNFSRRSDYAAMEVLLATVPFLNPRIQGLDRLYRGMKEDWKPFALKAGLMAASATALALFNWEENEEEMSKLKDEDKAMNYHIFLDLGSGPKEHWRIPKGFEVGQITGTLPEFFIEQLYADQAEPASKAIRRFMTTTFGLQMPQFAAPAYAIATNEDPFRQRPIINYGQQFLLPSAQFDSWTSKLIVDISQSMPDSAPEWLRSPKKFEYLIKGYTGSSGAMILEGIDDIYRMTGNAPDLPTKKTSELYMVRDFYRTGSVSSSKQMDLFYEMVMETGKLASTLKAAKETSRSEYRAMRVEHADKLRARKSLNKYSKRMSAMSSEMRKLMLNDVISRDEKERRKDALTKRKNALAQNAVDRYFYIFD
ncbi:MAG: hypothetical protein MJK15_00575 [Colwellia sp.]|nr:hypothetical protein [Colwellia sp.]